MEHVQQAIYAFNLRGEIFCSLLVHRYSLLLLYIKIRFLQERQQNSQFTQSILLKRYQRLIGALLTVLRLFSTSPSFIFILESRCCVFKDYLDKLWGRSSNIQPHSRRVFIFLFQKIQSSQEKGTAAKAGVAAMLPPALKRLSENL